MTPADARVNINEKQQYKAQAFYSDGHSEDVTKIATWNIDNDSVANVVLSGEKAGLVSGISHGEGNVMATFESHTGKAKVNVTDVEYLGINIEPANSLVEVGAFQPLTALAVYRDAVGGVRYKDVTLLSAWRTENPEIATVSAIGVIKGEAQGMTNVEAYYHDLYGEALVSVVNSLVTKLTVTPDNLSAPVGTKGRYQAIAAYIDRPDEDVTELATWSSSDIDVVHIVTSGIDGGTASANKVGSSEISAQFEDIVDSVNVQVTAAVIERIEITPRVDTVYLENITQFYAHAYFSDGTVLDVTLDANWKSDSPQIVTIQTGSSRAGQAMGVSQDGAASISADYAGFSDSLSLKAVPNMPESIEIIPNELTLKNGGYAEVQVMVTYSNGDVYDYAKYVDWSSSDDSIAYGHQDVIRAEGVGHATVTATMETVSGSAEVTVTP
ncbi:Ig-like domain-containing protein [Shewanella pealeana]|uniref:Ig-like domain-containing protein n=1 Tax=Shewanella pealeana TaxID=70864 RepID=UPI001231DB00|nr:Ig-like domain-containing protein [Shewanella pealeana]